MRKRRILSVTAAILLSLSCIFTLSSCVFSFKKAPQTDSGWSGGDTRRSSTILFDPPLAAWRLI